jgi:hypothetical protein
MAMPKNHELDDLLNGIVTTADCMCCKMCCIFHDDDKIDAPLFTEAQRDEVSESEYGVKVTFSERDNNMWQVDLIDRGDGSYVCPLLEQQYHTCNAREVDCFDCRTWPFYVMRKVDGQTVLTVSLDCPVVGPRLQSPGVQTQISQNLIPYMIRYASQNPGVVAEFRPETTVLQDVIISIIQDKTTIQEYY